MQGNNRQKGFTLIETLVGVALLATIGVALISGLFTVYKGLANNQESTYAENLAKSQVEYIRNQDYVSVINYDAGDPDNRYEIIDIPAHLAGAGYVVEINPPELVETAGISGYELSRITVKVKHNDKVKLNITFYRTGLAL